MLHCNLLPTSYYQLGNCTVRGFSIDRADLIWRLNVWVNPVFCLSKQRAK